MKNKLKLLMLLFLIAVFSAFLPSCEKDLSDTKRYHGIENSVDLVHYYNVSRQPTDLEGFQAIGEVKLGTFTDQSGEPIFYLTLNSPELEKYQAFNLQSETLANLPSDLPKAIENAQVVFLGKHLIVSNLDKPFKMHVYLEGNELAGIEHSDFNIKQSGYGLSLFPISKDEVSFRAMGAPDARCKCYKNGDHHPYCSTGGAGASSCSTSCPSDNSQCSVNCVIFYFACCFCNPS